MPKGPPEARSTSLCNNTTYAADPKLSPNWDNVDCPSCLAVVWQYSQASKSKLAGTLFRVPSFGVEEPFALDAEAVVLRVEDCTGGFDWRHHAAHVWYDRGSEEVWYCRGR